MKIADMKPGMYVLSETVKNPKPDRRAADSNFAKLPEWRKGLRVCVGIEEPENKLHPNRITVFRAGGYSFHGVTGRDHGNYNHPGFDALIAALRPAEWTDSEWLEVHVISGKSVLENLLASGKITREDILGSKQEG